MTPPQHVLIAANPKSGAGPSGKRVAALRDALSADYQTQIEHSLEELCQQALIRDASGQLRAVISAGGDGTAKALANLLPAHIPILLFPLGTENLLAKHLGISGDVRQTREILRGDTRLSLDVGRANSKFFLVMLSCGFDAEVVRQMHAIRTGHIKRWSYARPIIRSLARYSFPQLTWTTRSTDQSSSIGNTSVATAGQASASQSPSNSAAWLFVFNVPRYAASLGFCPQADPTDGLLDLCTFARSGIVSGLGYLGRLWLGSHQRMQGFRHERCSRLEIPAPIDHNGRQLSVPYQIDGDPGGVLPLTIEVMPARLSLLVPETPAT